jgi:hypothetical protein
MAMGGGYALGPMVAGPQAVVPVLQRVHPMYGQVPPGPLGPTADVLRAAQHQAIQEQLWAAQQQQQGVPGSGRPSAEQQQMIAALLSQQTNRSAP